MSNTAVSLTVDALLLAASVPYRAAAAAAFTAGAVNGYTWNRRWTFAARDSFSARASYLLVQVGGLAATVGLVAAVGDVTAAGQLLAYVAAAAPVTVATFLANRAWTFGRGQRA